MKRLLFFICTLLCANVLMAQTTFWIGDIQYEVTSTSPAEVEVNDANSSITTAIIPSTVSYEGIDYSVTSIGSYAFSDCYDLTSVTIGNSVTSIGDYAFWWCSSLTSVTIPNSVTSIGYGAFAYCISLTSVTIGNSVTSIGERAFAHCISLTSIDIPNSVTSIGNSAFAYCSSLTSVILPNNANIYSSAFESTGGINVDGIYYGGKGTVNIGNYTFNNVGFITFYLDGNATTITPSEVSVIDCDESLSGDIVIPSILSYEGANYSVTSIGGYAFHLCSSLTSVTIPNSVTSIGNSAFFSCSSLTSVTIPNSVTSIGNSAFSDCYDLTSVTIPNSVNSIGNSAFWWCSSLTSVTIPNSVTSIGNSAFWGCSNLTSVTCLAETAPSLGSDVFNSTPSTKVLNIPCGSDYSSWESATTWASVECIDIYVDLGNSLTYFPLTFAIISEEERTMKVSDCDVSATDVEIPARVMYNGELYDVTSIGSNAFEDCNSLTSVTIPNSVTSIGDYAFYGCSSLTSIDIPNSVTSIGIWAFEYCSSLTSVTIPNSVTSIGYQMFAYCSSLTSVTIPNSVTSIAVAAFSGCSSLTSVNIPNSVTSIGGSAFYKCSSLTSIDIPNSVTSIGSGAFEYCSSLTSVILPNNANISSDAFKNTGGINVGGIYYGGKETVNVGNYTFNNVGFITFYLNGNATTITPSEVSVIDCDESLSGDIVIPSILSYQEANYSVTSIVDYAFRYCSSLTSVTIPNSVTSIGSHAFCDCSSLTSVTIPNSVTSIRNFTFYDCSSLTSVTCLAETAPSLGSYVFSFTPSTKTLTYPCGSDYSTWQSATTWASVECIDIYVDLGNSLTYFPLTFEIISEEERTMKVSDCDVSVTDVEIPARVMYNGELYDVTSIGQNAFRSCSSLTSVTIPNSVTAIGLQAFQNCSSLTSVTIPNSVDTIGGYAFAYCYDLTSINIPNSVTYIGGAAFKNCSSLTSITIPNSVTSIYAGTFEYCSSLTSVTLSENITSIVSNAFEEAGVSASVVIDSVTYKVSATIPGYNIHGCGLITFHIGDSTYAPTEAMAYDCEQSRSGHVDILSSIEIAGNTYSVTSIGDYAFYRCSSLTSVTIPNSITYIGYDAFRDCSSLTTINFNAINCEDFEPSYPPFNDCPISTINIGDSVQRIPGYFIGSYFYGSPSSLTSITIPNSVTSIGECAFYGCKGLTSVTLPENITYIGSSAFYKAGVDASVIIDSVTYKVSPAIIPDSYYENVTGYYISGCGLITFHIGDSTYAPTEAMVYSCNLSRSGHVDIISSIEFAGNAYPVTSIGASAFSICSSLTSVTIPNSVTSIGHDAFYGCHGLTSVTIPNSVTSIGYDAFRNCSSLDSVICLAETAPTLGDRVFYTNLTKTLTVPFGSDYSSWQSATDWAKTNYLIQEGETKTLANDFTINATTGLINQGTLVIKPTGQLINETSTNVSGVFEIETPTLPNDKWSFVGAPFNGYKLEAIKEGTRDVAVSVFDYDSADWSEEFATIETPIRKGEGFLLWSFAEEATVFTTNPENPSEEYTLNNGGVSVTETLTTHEEGGNWMALANPYTFKLDIAKFLQDQSDVKGGIVYRLNGVSWEEVSEGVIGLTEGFFVNYANPGSQTATFVKSHRYTGTSSKAEKKKEYIKLYMNDGERTSKLSIAQNEEASQGDDIFDANKLFSPFEIAEPYFLTEGVALVKEEVKTLPYTATLNVKSYESKEVTFSVGDIPEDYNVYLIDNGFDIKMNDGVEYNTRIVAGENADRFKFVIKKAHRLTETVNKDIYVNNFNREVRISSTQKDLKIEVYDALGRKVFETKDYKFELNQVPAGAYMVKVYNRFARKDAKIVLH